MLIRTKIALLTVAAVIVATGGVVGMLLHGQNALKSQVQEDLQAEGYKQSLLVVETTRSLLEGYHKQLISDLKRDYNTAEAAFARAGGVSNTDTKLLWSATNQFTSESKQVELPQLQLGSTPIPQVADANVPVPGVDTITEATGATCTLFQKMEDGSLLRVATTVKKKDGTRAIGTFIPMNNPDGKPNPVAASISRGEPYVGRAFVVDSWYMTTYQPIKTADGQLLGALYVGVPMTSVNHMEDAISKIVIGKTGYAYVLGTSGKEAYHYIVSHQRKRDGDDLSATQDASGRFFIRDLVDRAVGEQGKTVRFAYDWKNPGDEKARQKTAAAAYFEPWGWVIGAGAYDEDFLDAVGSMNARYEKVVQGAIWLAAVLVGVLGVMAWLLGVTIARPISRVVRSLNDMASGEADLSRRLPSETRDEVGLLSRAFNAFIDNLEGIIRDVTRSSVEVATEASRIARASRSTTEGIETQAQQSQMVSMAMDQMSHSVLDVASRASEMAEAAAEAGMRAEEGGATVRQLISGIRDVAQGVSGAADTITALGARSERIGEILDAIASIAARTKLLALNATIEAARAGEHGRGFKVVADEVRRLAERTQQSTAEIVEAIGAIQSGTQEAVTRMVDGQKKVTEGVKLAEAAGSSLELIVTGTNVVTNLTSSVAATAEEQAATTQEVSSSVSQISGMTQQIAAAGRETAGVAESLTQKADHLRGLVARFHLSA